MKNPNWNAAECSGRRGRGGEDLKVYDRVVGEGCGSPKAAELRRQNTTRISGVVGLVRTWHKGNSKGEGRSSNAAFFRELRQDNMTVYVTRVR